MASGVKTVEYSGDDTRKFVKDGSLWTYEISEQTKMKCGKVTGRKLVFSIYQITEYDDGCMYGYQMDTVFETTVLDRGFEETFLALLEEGRVGKLEISGYTFKFKLDKVKVDGPNGLVVLDKDLYIKATKDELKKMTKEENMHLY